MQPRDRTLLTNLAIGLVVAWFTCDLVLGLAIQGIQAASRQERAREARAADNQRLRGNYPSYRGGSSDSDPAALDSFHAMVRLPLRFAGAAGLLLVLAFGPIGAWGRALAENGRARVGTALIFVAISLFVIAQVIVYQSSSVVMQVRSLTAAELEQDRRERTMTNPPAHLNPNPQGTGTLRSITFGSDRSERVAVSSVDSSVQGYIDLMRLVAGVLGGVGILYLFLSKAGTVKHEETRSTPSSDSKNSG